MTRPPDPARPGRHDVVELVQDLDPLQRDAVTLVYFDGRTPSEAARILGIAPRDVASALARAFRHVASWLADESPVEVLHEEPF